VFLIPELGQQDPRHGGEHPPDEGQQGVLFEFCQGSAAVHTEVAGFAEPRLEGTFLREISTPFKPWNMDT
jgi:hypothetical protein